MTFAIQPYDRVLPLIHGEVQVEGVTLEYRGMPGGNGGVFYDQLRFGKYDVSEMSISSFLIQRAKGWPYRMLPVFHNRNFSYTDIVIRADSGIRVDHPEDLRGKRFAIRDYQQSAGLWIRGTLMHEFGVPPDAIEWHQTRAKTYSLSGASGITAPVPIHYSDVDAGTLLARGDADATWSGVVAGVNERGRLSRGDVDVRDAPGLTRLFSDPMGEGVRYYKKTGLFPAHHITVVRESLLEEDPWVATALMEAFERAKQLALERQRFQTTFVFAEHFAQKVKELMDDPHPYGIRPNKDLIDCVQRMSVEQGLTAQEQAWGEIFPEEVLISEAIDAAAQ